MSTGAIFIITICSLAAFRLLCLTIVSLSEIASRTDKDTDMDLDGE